MKIQYTNSQIEFHNTMEDFLNSNEEETKLTVLDRTEAFYSEEGTCDTKWCDEHNIPYSKNRMFCGIGCIVAVKGNVVIDIKRRLEGGECLSDRFAKALCEYLKNKGLDSVRCDNNDVLVDDYKVASGAETVLPNGLNYMGFQISISQDLEAIRKICKKPMLKVPKALSEYGITTEEIVKLCEDYWTKE